MAMESSARKSLAAAAYLLTDGGFALNAIELHSG